jgi:hypothetical protein
LWKEEVLCDNIEAIMLESKREEEVASMDFCCGD